MGQRNKTTDPTRVTEDVGEMELVHCWWERGAMKALCIIVLKIS